MEVPLLLLLYGNNKNNGSFDVSQEIQTPLLIGMISNNYTDSEINTHTHVKFRKFR